jgi:hypothetical protein
VGTSWYSSSGVAVDRISRHRVARYHIRAEVRIQACSQAHRRWGSLTERY